MKDEEVEEVCVYTRVISKQRLHQIRSDALRIRWTVEISHSKRTMVSMLMGSLRHVQKHSQISMKPTVFVDRITRL